MRNMSLGSGSRRRWTLVVLFLQRRADVCSREIRPVGFRLFTLLVAALTGAPASAADWVLWGGPHRDFQVEHSEPLADSWPVDGPPILWKRPLGEGYSAIAVRGDTIYTMYRREAAF